MKYPKPVVGQQIYYIPQRGHPQTLTVQKVGNKYFTTGKHSRFHIETWREEFSHQARAYPSQEAYDAECKLVRKWRRLRAGVTELYMMPEVSEYTLDRAAALLGIDLESKE